MLTRRSLLTGSASLLATASFSRSVGKASLPSARILGVGLDKVLIDQAPSHFSMPIGPDIWIAEDGSDELGTGSFMQPLSTLSKAFSRAETIVKCKPGKYAPSSITGVGKCITAPAGGVVIMGRLHNDVILNEGGTLAIDIGVHMIGLGIISRPQNDRRPTTILNGCTIRSAAMNALTSIGGYSFCSNVKIDSPQYDGFNYGPDDDGVPNFGFEHNCHVVNAGNVDVFGRIKDDGSPRDNLNGSSSHSSFIARYGGMYEGSPGADIADKWKPNDGINQVSNNYGVLTRASKIGIGFFFAGSSGRQNAFLEQCKSERQDVDLLIEKAWVSTRGCDMDSKIINGVQRIDIPTRRDSP